MVWQWRRRSNRKNEWDLHSSPFQKQRSFSPLQRNIVRGSVLHMDWMNGRAGNRVRGTTYAFAALVLALFCWLGFAIAKCSTIFEGLEARLPLQLKLVVICGPVGLPLLGVVAAALILLSDLFRPRRWLPLQLTSVCIFLWMLWIVSRGQISTFLDAVDISRGQI